MATDPRTRPAKLHAIPIVLFAILSGLIDLFMGVFAKVSSIFWHPRTPGHADSPRRRKRGLALVVGGIEGPSPFNHSMVMGILKSGYRGAVVRVDWNAGVPLVRSLVNLIHKRHKERQADNLANIILDHRRKFADSPICLLAQSGGCWIVIRALEKLPHTVKVHRAVLLAPSISPGYDTRIAASRCEYGLVSVGGPGDFVFLGIGTLIFGTSDRVFSPSAGWFGWHYHPPGFVESRWHPDWLRYGYLGNHTSSSSQLFICHVLAPTFAILGQCGRSA